MKISRLSRVAVGVLAVSTAAADTVTWLGTTDDWGTTSNWSTGSVPGSGDDVLFDATGSANSAVNLDQSRSVDGFTVDGEDYYFTSSSGGLTLSMNSFTAEANGQFEADIDVILTGTGNISLAGGSYFVAGGSLTSLVGSLLLTRSDSTGDTPFVLLDGSGSFDDFFVGTDTRLQISSSSISVANSIFNDGTVSVGLGIVPDATVSKTIDAEVNGSGTLEVGSFTSLTFSGSSVAATSVVVDSDATMQLGDGGATAVSLDSATVDNFGELIINTSEDVTISGGISAVVGTGKFTHSGSGTVTLSAESTYTGATTIGTGTLVATDDGSLGDGGDITLGGGTLVVSDPWFTDRSISGHGTIEAEFLGESSSSITADGGDLAIGDVSSSLGFVSTGSLAVGSHVVTLLDSDEASLGSSTTIDGGTLTAANGFTLNSGDTLSGAGTVENGNSADTAFTNNGTVDGTGSGTADELEFTGYVTGSGTFTGDVAFSGTYAPGNSPGTVNLENFRLSSTSALVIDLAGTTQGVTYDFLDISGTATLEGGTLSVVLLDGFLPSYGDTFTFMEADGGIIGDFGSFDLPTLSGGLSWSVSNDGTFYSIAAVPEPGEIGWAIGLGMAGVALARRLANPSPRRREDG